MNGRKSESSSPRLQVSYSSTCSALNNKFQFPTFLRTIPNDQHQSTAMAQMVLHFGWTWVGIIAAEDDYGKYGIKDFKEQVEEAGVCISFSETLPKVKPQVFHISANLMYEFKSVSEL